MSLQSLLRVPSFTKVLAFLLAFFMQVSVKAWEVDMSRRQKDIQRNQSSRGPASLFLEEKKPEKLVESFFDAMGPTQEIVILNTEKGFVPESVKLKKGNNYKIHVVNVNEKEKNVSFILDAFSEHHGTYYGQAKTFTVNPKTEGIFSFQCPETAKQGRFIIYSDDHRKPASE